ncbi:S1/P1 nuclease [Cinnamomum micranthum f. kanehirae]|uniref:Aspergillus nuclease S1 n=1 Tax=Cinnamomum micranthum f. kanehirae TaxID=337451 RepID=A0A3S3NQF7_9MAGN|nr:S1/P1 nuclease [Cinnamomum micranthum f. kanehirae]
MKLFVLVLILLVGVVFLGGPGAQAWSKEGHIMTCRIAQALLRPGAAEAVHNLLPEYVKGDLSALCTWPDQIRHWYKYRWTSSLHFIDTPDNACTFDYSRDCHDPHGSENRCVAGAIKNFTSQLLHYQEGTSDRKCQSKPENCISWIGSSEFWEQRKFNGFEISTAEGNLKKEFSPPKEYNLTEALLFLSHFMGDIHQPLHVGFTSDEGGNTIQLRWFRHKSNLHHVWDREIILTALKEMYGKDMDLFQEDIQGNFTHGIWSDDMSSWEDCDDLLSCPNKFLPLFFLLLYYTRYAAESINLACKWGYKGITPGETLADDYFSSRFPIVAKRIAQGGVRLAMTLNTVFGEHDQEIPSPT